MGTVRNVPRGSRAWHGTLVANVADDVTFVEDVALVEVLTDGTADVFVNADGNDATSGLGASESYRIMAGTGPQARVFQASRGGGSIVSVISTGTPKYTVQEVPAGRA